MNKSNISVLYVEDDNVARENGIEYLENFFNTIYNAPNAIDALSLYKEHKPNIIVTDIEMPKLNGLEFVKNIREQDKETQVIITTAYSDKDYLFKAIELQLVKYLVKPVSDKDFEEALNICIENIEEQDSNIVHLSNNIIYDTYNQTLISNNEIIKLRTRELELLSLLIKHKNRYVTYTEIEHKLWYDSVMTKDALKTLIKNLKNKLPKDLISNLSGTGYKIEL